MPSADPPLHQEWRVYSPTALHTLFSIKCHFSQSFQCDKVYLMYLLLFENVSHYWSCKDHSLFHLPHNRILQQALINMHCHKSHNCVGAHQLFPFNQSRDEQTGGSNDSAGQWHHNEPFSASWFNPDLIVTHSNLIPLMWSACCIINCTNTSWVWGILLPMLSLLSYFTLCPSSYMLLSKFPVTFHSAVKQNLVFCLAVFNHSLLFHTLPSFCSLGTCILIDPGHGWAWRATCP